MRNLYNDGIWDVFSINDLETLKESGTMNVLAKTDAYLMVEAGKDFWKIDLLTQEVTQYKDFVSLEKDIDGKKVYSKNFPQSNADYGAVLYDTILNTDIKDLPNFSLAERQDYFEGTTKGVVKYFMKGEFEKSVEKNRQKTKEASNTLLETLNKQETKVLHDAVQVTMETLSIFYTLFSHQYKQHKKEQLIKGILQKLDDNELDIKDVLSDRILNDKVPELRIILDEWQKNIKRMKVETSTTIDEALKNQPQGAEQQIDVLTLPPFKEEVRLLVEKCIDDPKINEVAQQLANTDRFQQIRAEQFCKNMDTGMQYEFGDNFKEKIQRAFLQSGEKDPIDFAQKFISDENLIEEMQLKHPNISSKDSSLAMAYINHIIENGNNASQQIVAEKFMENNISEKGTIKTNLNIVFDIVEQVVRKIENTLEKKQQEGIKFNN